MKLNLSRRIVRRFKKLQLYLIVHLSNYFKSLHILAEMGVTNNDITNSLKHLFKKANR